MITCTEEKYHLGKVNMIEQPLNLLQIKTVTDIEWTKTCEAALVDSNVARCTPEVMEVKLTEVDSCQ